MKHDQDVLPARREESRAVATTYSSSGVLPRRDGSTQSMLLSLSRVPKSIINQHRLKELGWIRRA